MAELLRITPQDNVAVALTALPFGQTVTVDGITLTTVTDVPAGHKVALFPIKAGEKVIKYGFPIGYAKEDIPVGAHVHVHNLHTGLSGELTYEYHPTYPTIPEIPAATFMGYPRKDGRVGVRNELWILPTVGFNRIGNNFTRNQRVFHPFGAVRDPVRNGNGIKDNALTTCGIHTLFSFTCQTIDVHITGRDIGPSRGNANKGTLKICIFKTGSTHHGTCWGIFYAFINRG